MRPVGATELYQVKYQPSLDQQEMLPRAPEPIYGLPTPAIEYEALVDRFKEGNDTYDVTRGPSGRYYETVVFNAGQLAVARILKPSTSFSSAYKNPGNMIETALAAAANPDAAYIYVANFGNYPTGPMNGKDLRYIAQTGRYTTGKGTTARPYRPLGSVQDMAEALADRNLDPTHITADVEAGRLGLGLMSAFEFGSIEGAYLNGLDGISPSASYVRAKLAEDLASRVRRHGIGEDGTPGEVTPPNIKDVKRHMPNVYRGLGRVAHIAPLPVILFPRDVADKALLTMGLRGHNDLNNLAAHAVFQDMQAAMRHQHAAITLRFNTESAVHDIDECVRFGKLVLDNLHAPLDSKADRLQLLIGRGKLDQHTESPHEYSRGVHSSSVPKF